MKIRKPTKKWKVFSDKLYRTRSVKESDPDNEIVIVYPKKVYLKEVAKSEKLNFQHLNREGEESDGSNKISKPLNRNDQTQFENDAHQEFLRRKSTRVKTKWKIFTYDQFEKNSTLN